MEVFWPLVSWLSLNLFAKVLEFECPLSTILSHPLPVALSLTQAIAFLCLDTHLNQPTLPFPLTKVPLMLSPRGTALPPNCRLPSQLWKPNPTVW